MCARELAHLLLLRILVLIILCDNGVPSHSVVDYELKMLLSLKTEQVFLFISL